MQKNFEQIQKIIIASALSLGLLVSMGGIGYKYLFAKEQTFTQSGKAVQVTQPASFQPETIYSKFQLKQPVNVLVLGDQGILSGDYLNKEINKVEETFKSQVKLTTLTNNSGTPWSTLMIFNKFQASQSEQPDLILLYPGTENQQEVKESPSEGLYEAILQTAGKALPKAEIIMLQGTNLQPAIKQIQTALAKHYNLPLWEPDSSKSTLLELLKQRSTAEFTGNKITAVNPVADIDQYLSWQQIQKPSSAYLMDKPNVKENLPVLVGSQSGAYVESNFTGKAVGVLVKCVPDGGMARIYVDNTKYNIIDTYSPEPCMKYFLVADNLPPGEHRVRLIVLGQSKYPSNGKRIIWYGFDATGSKDSANKKPGE
ncbi:hypothetical protein Dred_2995 [Desulforamulus reducens MI-1]|uniref:Uncharacterized protein n=1 Tax=Desulforamulus reducens (strain ATCC BAA-1160 / DSM 100696 / MI-1) TaxID=349161 RepID=A4J8U5_DESRM|nr:hypothetical protein [Desulforamulus reducens]ABO51498.1 hypothetical protein Dred_2995 [Desulforamulus reducens MI-1]